MRQPRISDLIVVGENADSFSTASLSSVSKIFRSTMLLIYILVCNVLTILFFTSGTAEVVSNFTIYLRDESLLLSVILPITTALVLAMGVFFYSSSNSSFLFVRIIYHLNKYFLILWPTLHIYLCLWQH